jgi:hypothetical protein
VRKYLIAALFLASTLSTQTTVVAQASYEEGSRAYCEAKWARVVAAGATHGETEASFVDKCMSCKAKWDEMVASHSTAGQDRGAWMRKCAKGAYWNGYGLLPEYLLLGGVVAGGVCALACGGHGNHPPVSP